METLDRALAAGWIPPGAAENIRVWLTDERYCAFAPAVAQHLADEKWAVLNDVFWTVIPFGTAGRRGRMYPIGCNAINERTIGESARGLADYVRSQSLPRAELRCAIGYDTRHNSRQFAELCCEVMTAAGFLVYFLDGYRSTPEMAFAVRDLHCACGIMISASHNPPSDNAIKVFGETGGQLRPPHDRGVMRSVEKVRVVVRSSFEDERRAGRIVCCQEMIDEKYRRTVGALAFPGPRELKILFSPLHGVGLTSVLPILQSDGFTEVEVFAPHATPDGDFPNVPSNVANPENPAVFDSLIAAADRSGADLVLASDPDADRIGCAARVSSGGAWRVLTGNQIAVLLADFILRRRSTAGGLTGDHYIVKTLVTTDMLRRVADSYGVRTYGDVFTGFKWIGGLIDDVGPAGLLFAAEEAHGYLLGAYARDKDGAAAAMLLAELAAELKACGMTLHQQLDRLYEQVGYYAEVTVSQTLPGAAGISEMRAMMDRLRGTPPQALAGKKVARVRDYLRDPSIRPRSSGASLDASLDGAECDLLFFDTDCEGNAAAVRPSGTEPKLKFYLFARRPVSAAGVTDELRREVAEQLAQMQKDVLQAAGAPA